MILFAKKLKTISLDSKIWFGDFFHIAKIRMYSPLCIDIEVFIC